ncbi:uncharacterized protein [Procambarus clarkii]|uniref:uncharacterized protein isoform X2 n=1 Tax=Procambarus clarkii TaxID=6728 RepID=UPI001E678DA8|nr:uncharacterized protein LOC123757123 [Procambarus clarkii]XP_045596483.1 uncharacterized protein LOC123757123 [Procambarus clarkii]XP_045596484.1 uncharacterized protein LOC123757123 [Procambarus clarkii]
MPPFKKICSLTEICTEWVWRWLNHCLNHQAPPRDRMRQRQYVLSTLNPNIRQQLLNRIFNVDTRDVMLDSKCMLLEMLGDRSTQWVDLSRSGFGYIDEVFQFYRTLTLGLLINITRLGLICNVKSKSDCKYLLDINNTFYRVLNQMRHLQWVTLTGVGDRTILATLGANCYQLEHLDVSDSVKVDDEAVAALLLKDPQSVEGLNLKQVIEQDLSKNPCCETLSLVCVCGTQVSLKSTLFLLRCVPALTSFGGAVEDGSLCSVIELLQPDQGVTKFKLNKFWDAKVLPTHASLLNVACPKITSVTTSVSSLPSLHFLYPITSLTVDLNYLNCRNCANYIYNYLQVRGETLKDLLFTNSLNCFLDLAWLMELTPNLERLESGLYIEEGYEILGWKLLWDASVTVNSCEALLTLISHTPSLKNLSINFMPEPYTETFECINDELVIKIISAGALTRLQKLKIAECAITVKGLNWLFLHCSELSYIAPLLFWKNISQDDIQQLHLQAKQNNWELKLVLRE